MISRKDAKTAKVLLSPAVDEFYERGI